MYVKEGFGVVAALTTPNISSLSPSLSYVCISLQLLSLPSLSFLPSVLRSALALPRSRFCVKRGREVEDDWFSAPLATALHCTLLYSIPPPRPPPPCSLFITAMPGALTVSLASRAKTHHRFARGSIRWKNSQSASKTSGTRM